MNTLHETVVKAHGKEIVVERVFAAPRKLVFDAFTDCKHLKHWWGPHDWNVTYCDMDFRVGGRWHYCMTGPEGVESWGISNFKSIDAPTAFAYTDGFSNKDGETVPGLPVSHITVDFSEVDGGTKVVSRGVYASEDDVKQIVEMGAEQGIRETWDRLVSYLEKGSDGK